MTKNHKMMSYQNPPSNSDVDITAVPLVATNLPPTTTTIDHRSKRMLVAVVAGLAGTTMLVVAGGVVRMIETNDTGLTSAGKLVWSGHKHPFETCYQYGDTAKYCWSHSYYQDNGLG